MTEQRYDIVVQDKVARTIASSLAEIGASAKAASDQLKIFNSEMGSRTASAAAAAQAAATKTAAATARLNAEQAKAAIAAAKLDSAQLAAAMSAEKLATAQAKTALAQQRVATEAARTAEAQSKANIAYLNEEQALDRAVAAEQKAIRSKEQLAAATTKAASVASEPPLIVMPNPNPSYPARAGGYIPGAAAQEAEAVEAATMSSAAGVKAATESVTADVAEMESKTTSLFERFRVNAMAAFDSVRDFATGGGTRFRTQATELGEGAEMAGARLNTMGAKAGMTALSIRELLVVAREGGRGDFTRMAGSLSILAMSLDVLPAALTIAAVGFGGLYAANKLANTEAEKDSLKKYADSLGLTTKEMRKLSDTTLDAKGNLKTINEEQITYADTFNGLVKTIEDGCARWKKAGSDVASEWGAAFTKAGEVILAVYNSIDAIIIASGQLVRDEFNANMETLKGHPLQGVEDGLKAVAAVPGNVKKNYDEINKAEKQFLGDWTKNQDQAAKDRLKAEADAIKNNRGPGPKGPKPWDRAQNLANDNGALDAQLKNMNLYGDALERANQLEEISKKYREHNVPLTQAETSALMAKITAVQEGKRIQEAMTTADEAANGPARRYDDTLTALDQLLAQGAIKQSQYTAQLNMARRAFDDAVDPLAELNRELQKNGELMGLYGRDRDVAAYIQSLQAAAQAKGESIYKPGQATTTGPNGEVVVTGNRKPQLTDQAQGMVDEFSAQKQQEDYTKTFESIDPKQKVEDPTNSDYILSHQKQLYDSLAKLRAGDAVDQAKAAQQEKNLAKATQEAKLQFASDMFGQLASLSASKNKEIAAIGKAAAVAQATIDGVLAVQKALSSLPPPFSFVAAGVIGAMTAVNVAKIAGIGFEQGGYTGGGGTKQVAGVVHGQEYVMDASTTARLGIPALDALRSGANLSQIGSGNTGGVRVSVYPQPGVVMEEVSTSDDHIEMIARRTTRDEIPRMAPQAVRDDINRSANSHVSKAIQSQYGLKRNR